MENENRRWRGGSSDRMKNKRTGGGVEEAEGRHSLGVVREPLPRYTGGKTSGRLSLRTIWKKSSRNQTHGVHTYVDDREERGIDSMQRGRVGARRVMA